MNAYIPHVGWLRHEPQDEVVGLLRQGYFEASEQAFFWLYLRPGDTFIDCGAHIGLYSIVAARATRGDVKVVAVEPSTATAANLKYNLEHNGASHVRVVRSALWDKPGRLRFIEESQGRSAFARVAFDGEEGGDVEATALDDIVRPLGVARVALVKIDVEGAEPEVLRGARESTAAAVLQVLMVEFTEQNLRRRGIGSEELARQIEDMGYRLFRFSADAFQLEPCEVSGPIWHGNLFACRDPEAVNARLKEAPDANRRIAQDIIDRARACDRFKELEELDRYRALAGEVEAVHRWAREAEERAQANAALVEESKRWAEKAEERARSNAALAEESKRWAEKAEERARSNAALAEESKRWAENAEQRAQANASLAEERKRWAEQAEQRARENAALAEERLQWAEQAEERARTQATLAEERLRWAQDAEARAEVAREGSALADAHRKRADDAEIARRQAEEAHARATSDLARAEALARRMQDERAAAAATVHALESELRELNEEIAPLRRFARKFAWLRRLAGK